MKQYALFPKLSSSLLVLFFLFTLFPFHAAALPAGIEFGERTEPTNIVKSGNALLDGEVYTYTKTTGVSGSKTDFTVELSAIGQQYTAKITSAQNYNIVFVLDISGSMTNTSGTSVTKASTMVQTANNAIANLTQAEGNQIGIVTFSNTADTLVPLTTDSFRLSFSGTSLLNSRNSTSFPVTGGTNIQAGINQAYQLLNSASNPNATPVIILLSDGVPCYYWSSYPNIPTKYGYSQDGNGDAKANGVTTNDGIAASAYTIMQAAYLKTKLPNLQLYTIGFDIASNKLATATLNPIPSNVQAVTGRDSAYEYATPLSAYLDDYPGSYYYPDGAYTASNSVESLGAALNSIVTSINFKKPIAETSSNGALDPRSYVTMNYQIGTAFQIPERLTVRMSPEETYLFQRNGNSYYYDEASSSSANHREDMKKLSITLENKTIVWKIPASVIPCNSPAPSAGGTQQIVNPISLIFPVSFDANALNLTAGVYQTGTTHVTFYPSTDNPYYYQSEQATTSTLASNGVGSQSITNYYEITYPTPGYDPYSNDYLPSLTSFAYGPDSNSLFYLKDPTSVNASSYAYDYDAQRYVLQLSFQGETIPFQSPTYYQAQAYFTATDPNNPKSYDVTYFTDGRRSYSDAKVTAVNDNGITVTYGNGNFRIVFQEVPLEYSNRYKYYYGSAWQGYYFAKTSFTSTVPAEKNFSLTYNTSAVPHTLEVKYRTSQERYQENDSTYIFPTENGGYLVRTLSADHQTLTVTQFYIVNNTLYKQVTKERVLRDAAIETGLVSLTHPNSSGSITLKASSVTAADCLSSAKLTSKMQTNLATATSQGQADLLLTLSVNQPISSLGFQLGCDAPGADFSYQLLSAQKDGQAVELQNGALPALSPGTYTIQVRVKTDYADPKAKPASCIVSLAQMNFYYGSTPFAISAKTDQTPDANQQVKVVLISTPGH